MKDGWLTPYGLQIKLPMPRFVYKIDGREYVYDEVLDAWVYDGGKDIVKRLQDIRTDML